MSAFYNLAPATFAWNPKSRQGSDLFRASHLRLWAAMFAGYDLLLGWTHPGSFSSYAGFALLPVAMLVVVAAGLREFRACRTQSRPALGRALRLAGSTTVLTLSAAAAAVHFLA